MKISNTKNLEQLIAKHGQSIIKDKMRCESLIRDYYIGSILERNLLIQSLKIGIPQELLSNQKSPQLELILRRSISNMQNSYGIKDELTNWILETWKKALISPNNPKKQTIDHLGKPAELIINLGKNIHIEMVLIPAGKFMMGSKKGQADPFENEVNPPPENECPQHEVTLTKPFYLGKYEVMQEQWFEIMGANPSKYKGRTLPVTDVSWDDCQKFIEKLNSKMTGLYRLPTEAEWEYACRAGTTTAYSFGDEITPKDANYKDSKIGKLVAVGSYNPNAFGLYDMHGNVWEFCQDWDGVYSAGSVTDPKGPSPSGYRVIRGGSFDYIDKSPPRSSIRWYTSSDGGTCCCGFRLARTK